MVMDKHVSQPLVFYTHAIFERYPELTCLSTIRNGGLSGSFNLSLRAGDDPEDVIDNRARLSRVIGVSPESLTFVRQVHGADVAVVTKKDAGRGALDADAAIPAADAMITNLPGVPLVILVADCAVVSLYDPRHGAVGIAHAGWRGTAAGIAASTVAAMSDAYGSTPAELIAGIGPSIGPCCYEVGAEVVGRFRDSMPLGADRVIRNPSTFSAEGEARPAHRGKKHLDLWLANRLGLESAGLRSDHIDTAGICTSCHSDVFFSHRAEKGNTGRFAGLILLHAGSNRRP